jgi:hypothetical protein
VPYSQYASCTTLGNTPYRCGFLSVLCIFMFKKVSLRCNAFIACRLAVSAMASRGLVISTKISPSESTQNSPNTTLQLNIFLPVVFWFDTFV